MKYTKKAPHFANCGQVNTFICIKDTTDHLGHI